MSTGQCWACGTERPGEDLVAVWIEGYGTIRYACQTPSGSAWPHVSVCLRRVRRSLLGPGRRGRLHLAPATSLEAASR